MTLVWSGLALGAVYALVAIGYNLVYLSSHTFNFAQAQLMMVGTFVAYTGLVVLRLPVVVVAILAIVVVALAAAIEERVAVRPVPDHQTQLVTTLGVATVLNGLTQLIWGGQPLTVPFFGSEDLVSLLGGRVYPVELVLIGLAVLLVVVLAWLANRSMLGIALIGMAEDRDATQLLGIDVRKIAFWVFAASGALAGALGLFVGPKTYAVATLGAALALKGFVALAIGGFGSLPGALVGGLAVGLVESLAARYLGAEFSNLAVFVLLLVVLMTRPTGLFGRLRERVV
ncbi:branched-chain amino acid ABC transporter permease [Pseudonocardia xishanensis]|uniref:Branched-chain amino acid ABC transporter permease n=1 Tax=Pseudonocardia xishanensis TaxID=630995 RepID=A0ABP8RR19_9PSEU